MESGVSPERVAELLEQAPVWARLGLTAPNARTREAATISLAHFVCAKLGDPPAPTKDPAQLALPLP